MSIVEDPYKQFFQAIWKDYCDGNLEIAELVTENAIKYGLAVEEKYDPEIHPENLASEWGLEEGDPCYVLKEPSSDWNIQKALDTASLILKRYHSPEGRLENGTRTKIEEWEACYAHLFKQMNDMVQEIYKLQSREKAMREALVPVMESHREQAKASNFESCGCDYCKVLAGKDA